ncbi:MAG: hypothetical protein J6M02_01945 [Clostridia bacterium]|nr:hypothetical protein [Clostridia bacterium]
MMEVKINVVKEWLKTLDTSRPRLLMMKAMIERALERVDYDFAVGPAVPARIEGGSIVPAPNGHLCSDHVMSLDEYYVWLAYLEAIGVLKDEPSPWEQLEDNPPILKTEANPPKFLENAANSRSWWAEYARTSRVGWLTLSDDKDCGGETTSGSKDGNDCSGQRPSDDDDFGGIIPCCRDDIYG